MHRPTLVALLIAGLALVGCDRKGGKARTGGAGTDGMEPTRPGPPRGPRVRPVPTWLSDLRHGATNDRRYAALDRFVTHWPADRDSLPDVLDVMVREEALRGGFALSLARLGAPLVPALVTLVGKAPKDGPTLLAAGVLAYSLVSPQGMAPLPEPKRAELRRALAPLREALWPAFLADTRPDYEIYQGLATGGLDTAKRFQAPVPEGGLTRVAMVLYLMLTRLPNEILLPEEERKAIRGTLAPLAVPMAKALATARPGLAGESPDSLLLGLSVLGSASAAALTNEPAFRAPEGCEALVKVLVSLDEQSGPRTVAPAREALARCTGKIADPTLTEKAKALLPKLTLPR